MEKILNDAIIDLVDTLQPVKGNWVWDEYSEASKLIGKVILKGGDTAYVTIHISRNEDEIFEMNEDLDIDELPTLLKR